jgi:hypothetical protein
VSGGFVAFIPYAIESDWDDIWAPRLAGFTVNLCYAEFIQGCGMACATYVFDPSTFVDGVQSRQMRYRPTVKTSTGLQKTPASAWWFGCGRHPTRVRLFRGNGAGLGQGRYRQSDRGGRADDAETEGASLVLHLSHCQGEKAHWIHAQSSLISQASCSKNSIPRTFRSLRRWRCSSLRAIRAL